jgi:hypothetical protein
VVQVGALSAAAAAASGTFALAGATAWAAGMLVPSEARMLWLVVFFPVHVAESPDNYDNQKH